MSAALAGIAVEGEQLMRRLTDLDLAALPAAGKLAGVAGVRRRARRRATGSSSRRSTATRVVEAVRDLQAGLA